MAKIDLMLFNRFRGTAPWALRHLVFSLGIACLIAALVVYIWFPSPYMIILGGWSLFFVIISVDVVCGPILTLILLYPNKSRFALAIDFSLILALQISALFYGLYSLSQARPIAVVFEIDRFRVVSYADIDASRPNAIPPWVSAWGTKPPLLMGLRSAKNADERFESLNGSLQGVEPSQRPDWWQDYQLNLPQVKQRAKRLDVLLALNPQKSQLIQSAAAAAAKKSREYSALDAHDLLWLPLVSRKSTDWVAFIDPDTGGLRGFVQADGFGERG